MPDGGDIIQGLTSTAENVLAPAAVGAGVGAGTAALTGGDPGKGALFGGAAGGIGGGANWAFNGPNPIEALFGGSSGDTAGVTGGADPGAVLPTTSTQGFAPPAPGGGGSGFAAPTDLTGAAAGTGNVAADIGAGAAGPQAVTGFTGAPGNTPGGLPAGGGDQSVAAGGGGFGKTLSDFFGKAKADPGSLVSALGLGVAGLNQGPTSQEKALLGQAQSLGATGQSLTQYLQSGGLPAGAQAGITNATNAAKASIRSKYAQLGLSGSSMEVQELNNVDSQAAAQVFAMQDQLLKQGQDFSGLSAQLYEALIKNSSAQDTELMNAISGFAGSLGGGGTGNSKGGTTIRIGGGNA